MDYPIHNPVVPFATGLSQMTPGLMIHVEGTPQGNRFSINLKTGPGGNDDVGFHFNPRFDGRVVVRNTKTSGRWGAEDRSSNTGFPFAIGSPFQIIILCQQHQFKVAVNGRHFIQYTHRLHYQTARYLTIEGSVILRLIKTDFETPSLYPPAVPKLTSPNSVYVAQVPYGNIRNHKVTVQGIPQNRSPQRFGINFQTAPEGELFFRFAIRMDERIAIRNTRFGGQWGAEDRSLSMPFPFQYGVPYQLVIHVEQGAFRVELNGMSICTFPHRKRPLTMIRQIEVTGATSVTNVSFN